MKRSLLVSVLVLLAACEPERITREEYLELVPSLLEVVEAEARESALGRPAEGPPFVNLASLRRAGFDLTGERFDSAAVEVVVPKRYRFGDPHQVFLCEESGQGLAGCWVREYGVYLNVNQARATEEGVRVTVRTSATDRRAFPTTWCDRVWRLRFREVNDEWELVDRELLRDCFGEE